MNNLKNLNDDLFNLIIDKLDGESLFNFMELKLIKNIEGTKRVDKFVNYCKYTEIFYYKYDFDDEYEELNYFMNIFEFNNNNIKILAKYYKLKYFSDDIKQDKELVLEFIKNDPYNLRWSHVKFLDDKDIIMLVANKYGYIVESISDKLADDDDILDIAISNNKSAIKYASERIQNCHNDLLQEVNTYLIWTANTPLKHDYYLDEKLTDDKYVKMRYLHKKHIEEEENIRQEEIKEYNKKLELIKKLDDEYRKKYGLAEYEKIYRNEFLDVISEQDYLDDYYKNHHHYIDGYE